MSELKLSEKLQRYRTDRPDEWTMDEFTRDALKLEAKIAELEKANEWISVEDRLPGKYGWFLIRYVGKSLAGKKPSDRYDVDYFDFDDLEFNEYGHLATHWMPITPPKG